MPLASRLVALALTVAVLVAGVATLTAHAQNPSNAGAAKGQPKSNVGAANKKKAARRMPRGNGAAGVIVPYPMPPVLIIRQTPEAHDEIWALLNMLRYY